MKRLSDLKGDNVPTPPVPTQPGHDEAVLHHVERFAAVLTDSGVPPMPARVFAYVFAHDAAAHTAADLATGLGVSPAAISGAVRYLVQVGLLVKTRRPGSAGAMYQLRADDPWYEMYRSRFALLRRYQELAAEGVRILGPDTPGGRRMRQSADFFAFLDTEFPAMMQRWRDRSTRHPNGHASRPPA